jgi:ABC-type transport system involved in multi-copper enzyme maturation permease subunit
MVLAAFTREPLVAVRSGRFLIALLLCLILMPLVTYVNASHYELRLTAFHMEEDLLEKPETHPSLGYNSPVETYRPPSPYSPFVMGLDRVLPDKIVVTPQEVDLFTPSSKQTPFNGTIDIEIIVAQLVSLLAFMFAASSLAGERESGELKFVLSGPLSGAGTLLCKFFGNASALVFALVYGFVGACFVAPIASHHLPPDWFYYGITLFALSVIYLLSQLALGMFVATFVRRASMVVLVVIWVVLALIVPRIIPLLADLVVPVQPPYLVKLEKDAASTRSEFEKQRFTYNLYDSTMRSFGLDPATVRLPVSPSASPQEIRAHERYWALASPTVSRLDAELLEVSSRLESEAATQLKNQEDLASLLDWFSPTSVFSATAAQLSGTGRAALQSVRESASAFRKQVGEELYARFEKRTYGLSGSVVSLKDRQHPAPIAYPRYQYRTPDLSSSIKAAMPGIITLFGYTLAFGVALWLRFRNLEVR